jgi:predicted  nucleic acid-binding Zn-ribbon protein
LDVQDLDASLDQVKHQLRTMPEIAELDTLGMSRTEIGDQARDAQIRVDDLTREQKKADADVEQVKARRKRDQDRIEQGLVGNPKDLERMQHELVSLERRINELEDHELDVMEQLETAQKEHEALGAQLVQLDELIATTTTVRDETTERLNAEGRKLTEERKRAVEGMPEDLMALYIKLREQKNGVGAAALRARRCGGCRLEVNAADLSRIASAPSDEVIRCEECGRVLVRTSESGI